ncbi:MAG: hypothetical protein AAB691_00265 [Patescibacteria group bacterium]
MLLPSFKVYVADSKIENGKRGVFSLEEIEKGEIIERCPIIEIDGKEIWLGFGLLYQHSDQANATYENFPKDNLIKFVATKNIGKNEEITVK